MIKGLSEQQLKAFAACYPQGIKYSGDIIINEGGNGIDLRFTESECYITVAKSALLWRAFLLLEEQSQKNNTEDVSQKACYNDLGLMVDCSRNAVLNMSAFKQLVITLAKMGYTVIQLYMEDTFELPQYPYFGYKRGFFTKNELREMDLFASMFGIELIPAIQTLAHLGQTLKWDAFGDIVDFGDILLADEEKTYDLLESIFSTMSECFTSHRINIGMDEAHMVGLGKYLDKHGYQPRIDVMLKHFTRVHDIAVKHGFKPMLWSDMFFRLASGGDYYAPDCNIDSKIKEVIPKDTTLVYWDYYSENIKTYNAMLDSHAKMSDNIIFAGGAWKWTGFNPNNQFSIKIADLAHESCVAHGVGEVLVTAWGDNGGECSMFAVLPALQYWAELCYAQNAKEDFAKRFSQCTGGNLEEFLLLDNSAFTPHNPAPGGCGINPPKYILYQDIMDGLFDAQIEPNAYSEHFANCAKALHGKGGQWALLFKVQEAMCAALELKCRVGLDIHNAYHGENKDKLKQIKTEMLPQLTQRVENFAGLYRMQWKHENKIAGLDVFDIRIGGLLQRICSAQERIGEYLDGETNTLEELETPTLPYSAKAKSQDIAEPMWHKIVSASSIAMI
ncbi:MAG: beta-N-acetylhexosaminidase [Oscillospiraceae bacterium]